MMEFWKVAGILMCKKSKTVYLSIHLGSSYDVRIAYVLDQGNWDINTYSIIKYQWIFKFEKTQEMFIFLINM